MLIKNYYQICIINLLINKVLSDEIVSISSDASWNQTGITIVGSPNGIPGSSLSELRNPLGLTITNDDILYVGDTSNHRIVVVYPDSTRANSIIGSGPGTQINQFKYPRGIFILDSFLYVLDRDNRRIKKLSFDGSNPSVMLNYDQTIIPLYLYFDNNMNLYLSAADQHKIVVFRAGLTVYTNVAGTGIQGSDNTQLNQPYGIFVDRVGTLYIADRRNHRIMKWPKDASSGIRVAGDGTAGSASTQLNGPMHVILDINDHMYIAEGGNNRITRWKLGSLFGVCIAACTGTSGSASTQINLPHALAFDNSGSLYITEWNNNRVQKFQILPFPSKNQIKSKYRPSKFSMF